MNRNEFIEQYEAIVKRALHCAAKARKESLLGLESEVDHEKADKRDIFEYGLRFLVDGTAQGIIDNILYNILDQEKDEQKRILKVIQRVAIVMIQDGMGPEVLYAILNSYTDIPLSEDKAKQFLPPPEPETSGEETEDYFADTEEENSEQ